ncbi:MAG TPA: ABC transporter substrate-binding protein [Gaiellaceae bacterium]|nr:ABC transporter substrate-binding protein [Gaiellaceae bacterium]
MKRRLFILATLIAVVSSVVVSMTVAAAATTPVTSRTAAAIAPPAVPNAAAIKAKYGGQSITFIGDNAVGQSHVRDLMLAARFKKDTGITVKVVPHPAASDAAYSQLARAFSAKSSSIDVMMLDVVWPGAFAPYLVDLKPALGAQAKLHAAGIIQNDTVGGHLVAMPWFGDFGILYYRTDLLKKYGFSGPPTTWAELGSMAKTIQAGEQKTNPNFYGFVWQGNSYEGLTCDALEWVASSGGGTFVNSAGKVTINNPKAAEILNLVRSWVGTIAPRGVTSYQEEDARNAFDAGNAAFMRNWPYAYAASKGTPVDGKFDVTVLPHGAGSQSVGTVGGWQLGVSKYSKHQAAAIEWVRYLTSPAVERFDAIFNSNVPTIPAVAKDPAVVKANPYLKPEIATVARVTRPAAELGAHYPQGSQIIYQAVNQIENGTDANSVLPSVASQLQALLK